MDIYYAYHITSTDEIIVGLLSQFEFESFVEEEDKLIAYIKDIELTELIKEEIGHLLKKYNIEFTLEEIAPQNWNALWESSFQPVYVGDFCQIRADFHPALPDYTYDIVINPKMAFGTGHHATTYMMIAQMQNIDFSGKSVFDFGAGTGILAILAAKMGARAIDAIDIEEESYRNIVENSSINGTSEVQGMWGTLDDIKSDSKYDIILANINRNILVQSAEKLKEIIKPDGCLLLSGILTEDKNLVLNNFNQCGFEVVETMDRDHWSCIRMTVK